MKNPTFKDLKAGDFFQITGFLCMYIKVEARIGTTHFPIDAICLEDGGNRFFDDDRVVTRPSEATLQTLLEEKKGELPTFKSISAGDAFMVEGQGGRYIKMDDNWVNNTLVVLGGLYKKGEKVFFGDNEVVVPLGVSFEEGE